MANTKRFPPIHPGEVLREEFLTPLSLSANQLALALRVPATRINDILHEKRGITADTALRLSRYFGTTAKFWLNLQASYEVAEEDVRRLVREGFAQIDGGEFEEIGQGGTREVSNRVKAKGKARMKSSGYS